MKTRINKLITFYIFSFLFFSLIYIFVSFVNLEPTQINTRNLIFKKLKYYTTQRWVFFTKDTNKEELFLYDTSLNKINVSLSSKNNAYGLKRKSSAIATYLLDFSREISIYKWQDFNYTLKTKPIVNTKDTLLIKYKPYALAKGIYVLEKRPVIPYEWKNNLMLNIQSKYVLIKVD